MYQELVNIILKDDIFINKIKVEDTKYLEFQNFIENNKNNIKFPNEEYVKKIFPDFFVSFLSKDEFLEFIEKRKYMVLYDKLYNDLKNKNKIYIIGEVKENPERIISKSNQRNNYIKLCRFINENNEDIFFFTMYVFDISYKNFWKKTLYRNNPIIYSYIPKLFVKDYFDYYKILKDQKNKDLKDNNQIEKEDEEIIKYNIKENEKGEKNKEVFIISEEENKIEDNYFINKKRYSNNTPKKEDMEYIKINRNFENEKIRLERDYEDKIQIYENKIKKLENKLTDIENENKEIENEKKEIENEKKEIENEKKKIEKEFKEKENKMKEKENKFKKTKEN